MDVRVIQDNLRKCEEQIAQATLVYEEAIRKAEMDLQKSFTVLPASTTGSTEPPLNLEGKVVIEQANFDSLMSVLQEVKKIVDAQPQMFKGIKFDI